MNRQYLILPAVALLSALAGILVSRVMLDQPQIASAQAVAPTASDLAFADLRFSTVDGHTRKLGDWHNPILVINFWAPWCAPCRREIPAFIELQQKHADKLQVIGIALDSADNVRQFTGEYPFNYPLLLMPDNSTAINRFFGNTSGGLPFTTILDTSRNIVFRHAGEITLEALEDALKTTGS